jgi:GT2 family glycosyltransferase
VRTEVCVVAYRNEDTIAAMVESLARLGAGVGLAVHDNGPGAGTLPVAAQAAERLGLPFRAEPCPDGNCGFGIGCNALAAGSTAQDLLFLNPDARVLQWPTGLTAGRRIVGATVVDLEGRPLHTMGRHRRLRDEVALRWLRRMPAAPAGSGYVSGAALLVAREVFAELGGFDAGYFMYYEDIDLCARAGDAGVAVVHEPGWRVEHVGGHSVGRSQEALTTALLRSYRGGRRFHSSRSGSTRPYDMLAAADALAHAAVLSTSPSRRVDGRAHLAVAKEAAAHLVPHRRSRP